MTPPNLEELVREHMARYKVPGLSLAMAHHGTVAHAAGYGFANLEHGVAATSDTVYQTASVGKQFTAALVMMLVERGVLVLDQPLEPEWHSVTIRQLLTHTSGISDAGLGSVNYRLDYPDDELLARILGAPPASLPGTTFEYSNAGYVLLGLRIAQATGRFYGDLLHDWIFTPLEMTTARVINEAEIIPNRAAGYETENGIVRNQEYVSPSLNRTADGSLYISVADLAKWDRELCGGRLLSSASREAMWMPVRLADGSTYPYGFGWDVNPTSRGRMVSHDGEWQGFSTHFRRYPDDGLSIMILCNQAEAPVSDLADAIVAAA